MNKLEKITIFVMSLLTYILIVGCKVKIPQKISEVICDN